MAKKILSPLSHNYGRNDWLKLGTDFSDPDRPKVSGVGTAVEWSSRSSQGHHWSHRHPFKSNKAPDSEMDLATLAAEWRTRCSIYPLQAGIKPSNIETIIREGLMWDHYVGRLTTIKGEEPQYGSRSAKSEKVILIKQHGTDIPWGLGDQNNRVKFTVFDGIVRDGGTWYVADFMGREYAGSRSWYNPRNDMTVAREDLPKKWLESLQKPARTQEELELKYFLSLSRYSIRVPAGDKEWDMTRSGTSMFPVGATHARFEINDKSGLWYWQEKLPDWELLSVDEKDELLQNLVIAGMHKQEADTAGADQIKSREFLNTFFDDAAVEFRKEQRSAIESGELDRDDSCLLATAGKRQDKDCFEGRLEKALSADYAQVWIEQGKAPPIITRTINEKKPLSQTEKDQIAGKAAIACAPSQDNPQWVQHVRDLAVSKIYGGSGGNANWYIKEYPYLEYDEGHAGMFGGGQAYTEKGFRDKITGVIAGSTTEAARDWESRNVGFFETNISNYIRVNGLLGTTIEYKGTYDTGLSWSPEVEEWNPKINEIAGECKEQFIYDETQKILKSRPLSKRAIKLRERVRNILGADNADIIGALSQSTISSNALGKLLSDQGKRAEIREQYLTDASMEVSDQIKADAAESKRSRLASFSELTYLTAAMHQLSQVNSSHTYREFSYLRRNQSGTTIADLMSNLPGGKQTMLNFSNAQLSALVPLFRLFRVKTSVSRFEQSDPAGAYGAMEAKKRTVDEVEFQGQNFDPSKLLEFGRSNTLGMTSFSWTFDSDFKDTADRTLIGTLSLHGDSLTVFEDENNNYNKLLDVDQEFRAVVGWHIPQTSDRSLFSNSDLEAIRQSHVFLEFYFTLPTFEFKQDGSFELNLDFVAKHANLMDKFDILRSGPEGGAGTSAEFAGVDSGLGMKAIENMNSQEEVFKEYIRARQATKGDRHGTDVFGREAKYASDKEIMRTGWENRTDKYRNFRDASGRTEAGNKKRPGFHFRAQKEIASMYAGKAFSPRDMYGNKTGEAMRKLSQDEIEMRIEQKNLKLFLNGAVPGSTAEAKAKRDELYKKIVDFVAKASGNVPGTPGSTGILKASEWDLAYTAMDSFRKVNNPRKNALYSKIWKNVEDVGRVFYVPIKPEEIEQFLGSMQMMQNPPMANWFRSALEPATMLGVPEVGVPVEDQFDRLRDLNVYNVNNNFVDATSLVNTGMQMLTTATANATIQDFRQQGCHLLYFTYFGDLMQAIFSTIGREMTLERLRLVFGTVYYKDYFTKGRIGVPVGREVALVDIPISKELFMAWFHKHYVARPVKEIPIGDFIKNACTTLIRPYLTGEMFNFVSDTEKLDVKVYPSSVSSDTFVPFGEISSEQLSGLLYPGKYAASSIPYSYVAYSADYTKTAKHGKPARSVAQTPTLSLGQSRGLLLEAEFSRTSMPHLEAQLFRDGGRGIGRMRLPYTADIKMVGNNLFIPGSEFHLIPTIPGARAAEIAGNLGLGGKYMAQQIENVISSTDGWITEFKAINTKPSGISDFEKFQDEIDMHMAESDKKRADARQKKKEAMKQPGG